jgi:3-oxoacyl-[acyl-carrier protein] reductase
MLDEIARTLVEYQKLQTPIEHRVADVQEIAGIIAMLAGKEGSWITGQCISASGVSSTRC